MGPPKILPPVDELESGSVPVFELSGLGLVAGMEEVGVGGGPEFAGGGGVEFAGGGGLEFAGG